jgi:hypothetical protein
MANIKPDPRENMPKVVPGRTDAWLRRNGEGRFVRRLRVSNRREGAKRAYLLKTVK